MKILLYENRKSDPIGWDISTKEKQRLGFLALFNHLDKVWKCYGEIEKSEEKLEGVLSDLSILGNLIEDSEGGIIEYVCRREIKDLKRQQDFWERYKEQYVLLQSARKGNAASANYLLSMRVHHEYEGWQIIEIKELV